MARPTMTDLKKITDVALSNLWDVTLMKPSGVSFDADDINLRAVSSDLPKRTGATQELIIRGQKTRIPGDYDYSGTITLTLVETDDLKVHKLIQAWREAIIETDTGKGKKKSEIETSVILNRLDKQGNQVGTYTLYGVFLEDYDLGQLNETAEIVNITLTLSYDYFKEDYR